MVTVAVPQLSLAVITAGLGTLSQEAAVFAGVTSLKFGATVSSTVIVCDIDEVLLQASVKVQVLVTVNELGQLPGVVVSTPSTVICPAQLSFAVSEVIAGTSVAQVTVMFAGASGATGA
jgi:hypothetical protein